MRTCHSLLILLLLLTVCLRAQAQEFTEFSDEAEEGGFDLIAQITALPVEWKLNTQENGDAYHLKLTSTGTQLFIREGDQSTPLAISLNSAAAGSLVIQRRGSRWIVIANHRVILQAEDGRWLDGTISVHGAEIENVRLQPVEEIVFDDDFMRVAKELAITDAFLANPGKGLKVNEAKIEEETIWKILTGAWITTGIAEQEQAMVAQSANPFAFASTAKGENFAVAGRPFWSDYSVEAAAKPHAAQRIGVALYVQNEKNYLLFDWQQNGLLRIVAVVDGTSQVLAAGKTEGYDEQNWYQLKFSARDGVLRAFIDEHEVLRARTQFFGRGQVGFFAENADIKENEDKKPRGKTAVFDDLRVRSVNNFTDNFSVPVAGRWQDVSGVWKFQDAAFPTGAITAFAVTGETDWHNYTVSADIHLPADAVAGLVAHHEKRNGAYIFRVTASKSKLPSAGKAQIIHVGAKSTSLAELEVGNRYDDTRGRWSFSTERGYLQASIEINGRVTRVLDVWNEGSSNGRAGIYAQRGEKGTPILRDFAVEFSRKRSVWAAVPDIYVDEKQAETMGAWSTPEGLWLPNPPIQTSASLPLEASAKGAKTFWHKGIFWGDQDIHFKMPALKNGENLTLILDRISPEKAQDSAPLILKIEMEEAVLKVSLLRGAGEVLQEVAQPIEGELAGQPIEISRRGRYMIVRIGDEYSQSTLLATKISE